MILLNNPLREPFNSKSILDIITYKHQFNIDHPHYFKPSGCRMFVGSQGSGKTLSGVNYCYNLMAEYPRLLLVTNVAMRDYPFNARLCGDNIVRMLGTNDVVNTDYVSNPTNPRVCVEYSGLDCLKYINNGEYGVLYFVDELHLELNSLESKNIDIDIITEISQQRKQRKHIVGTSQVFQRLAKPVREQIKDVIQCRCFFGCIQFNKLLDGETAVEVNGHLKADCRARILYIHNPDMYGRYDTYAKMRRLNKEWQGRPRQPVNLFDFGGVFNDK